MVDGVFKSLGFGFVFFENEQDAQKFVKEYNGKTINGKPIKVQLYQPFDKRDHPIQNKNLYIKNFPDSFDENKISHFLEEKFAKFGKIIQKGIY